MKSFNCRIRKCEHLCRTRTGIRTHIIRKHHIKKPKAGKHYQQTEVEERPVNINQYRCKECGHQVGTVGGIRGHVWTEHRNRGKIKKGIHKGIDFVGVEEEAPEEQPKVEQPKEKEMDYLSGMDDLSDDILVSIVVHGMSKIQLAAFAELWRRYKKRRQ